MEKNQNDWQIRQADGESNIPIIEARKYLPKQPGNLPLPNKQNIPAKPDINRDPTRLMPGVNDPEKIDPTRIDEPPATQPE